MSCQGLAGVDFLLSMPYMKAWASGSLPGQAGVPARGDHVLLRSKVDGDALTLFAMCWSDRKPKTFISTRGFTMEGAASVRPRHKKVIQDGVFVTVAYSKSVKRPMMINSSSTRSRLSTFTTTYDKDPSPWKRNGRRGHGGTAFSPLYSPYAWLTLFWRTVSTI